MENTQHAFAPRISLALSGGAARGAFHIGVLRSLLDHNIEVAAVSGSSIGAVIGAAFCGGKQPEDILEIFKSKAFKKMMKFSFKGSGFISMDSNAAIISELFTTSTLESLKIPLSVTLTNYKEQKIQRFDSGEIFPIVTASSALVPLFKPVTYNHVEYIDGGVFDNLPIEPLKKYQLPILGINLHPNESGTPRSKLGWFKCLVNLGWQGNILENINQCDYYLAPQELHKLPLFSLKSLDDGYDMGRRHMDVMIENEAFSLSS